jgi:hypothetical protein
MIKRFSVLSVAALGFLAAHTAAAKQPVDRFAEFKGSFSGSASFVISTGQPPYTGSGTLVVSGPKNGKSVALNFSGTISTGGSIAPYSNTIVIQKSGSYTVSSGIFNLAIVTASGVTGQAHVSKKTISGTGSFTIGSDPASITFSIQSKTSGKKRNLTVNYTINNAGGSFPFQFVVTGKAKK